ncbi:MAG: hypothetical protein SFY67_00020 [Candidatus Melainabacteria bacterium]|nr:hypothetical protein [Candidatus Melainabacteria bacterium]
MSIRHKPRISISLLVALILIVLPGSLASASEQEFDLVDAVDKSESIFGGEVTKIIKEGKGPDYLMRMYIEKYAKGPRYSVSIPIKLVATKIANLPKPGDRRIVFIENAVPTERSFDLIEGKAILPYSEQNFETVSTILNPEKRFLASECVMVCESRNAPSQKDSRLSPVKCYKGPCIGCSFNIRPELNISKKENRWILFIENLVPVDGKFEVQAAVPYSEIFMERLVAVMEKYKGKAR